MKKKLHILFLCGWYPSKVLTTNGDFIQRHAEAVSLKHKVSVVHIISKKDTGTNSEITFKKINDVLTYIGYVKPSKNPLIKAFRFWKTYQKILQKIEKFDLVHLNEIYPFGIFALHLKKFKQKPFIVSEHWTGYHFPQSKKINFIEKQVSKQISKKASFVCPVSNNLKSAMQQFGLKGNYKSVPNVVDTALFKPNKKNIKDEFTIIHVSSLLDVHKNISGMLRVARKLEEKIGSFTWKFIGGTSTEFSTLIKSLNFTSAKIEFINHISQTDLVLHMQKANLCISFSNYETFGIVITEAISCGIPVISTDTGVLTEFKKGGYFKIIPIKDEAKLLQEIIQFKKTKKLDKEEMHQIIVNNYSKKVIAEKFSNLYFKIIN